MQIANMIELHYYFDDESHSMDAHIRNKCESELLAIIYETSNHLGIDIQIDSEATKEGGIKDTWRLFGKNSGQISVVVAIVALILSRIPVSDKALDNLKKEETLLSIQEKQLYIAKLRNELHVDNMQDDVIDIATVSVDSNFKIMTRKSNFYKYLCHCHKVNKIGISRLDTKYHKVGTETVVSRNDFIKFILHSNELPTLVVDNAVIEIVSPVLKEGNYKWRGNYNGELITFSMIDKDFKREVMNRNISFQHGTAIECVLKSSRILDEVGNIVVKSYSVDTVLAKIDGIYTVETKQGKRFKHNKKLIESQGNLFND